jgi:capsular exopolysaccharide synthesis family protein
MISIAGPGSSPHPERDPAAALSTPAGPEPDGAVDLSSVDRPWPGPRAARAASKPEEGPGPRAPRGPAAVPADADVPPPGYGYPPAVVLPGSEVHLLDYVRILHKRRYTALTAFVLVVTAVTVYTFTKTPIYQARVQLQIENTDPKVVPFATVDGQQGPVNSQDYYQTQYKILQSRSLAKRTIDSLNLWNHPLLSADQGKASALQSRRSGGDSDAAKADKEPSTGVLGETPAQSSVIDRLLAGLTVSPIRNSRLVDVKFSSPDPRFAARVAQGLADSYIGLNLEYRFNTSKEATDFLGQQLAEQRKAVEASEGALLRYREQTDSVSLEDKQNIVVQKLTELNAAVTRAKTERLQKEAAYNQIVAIQHDRAALDAFPAILSNGFIQQLKGELSELQRQQASLGEKYGEKHVEMIRIRSAIQQTEAKLQGEIGKVVQALRNDYQAAQSNEGSLMQALRQQESEAMELSRKGIDYGSLQRDATTNRAMYESLLQRAKETNVAGELKASNIRVVDPATVPRSPISPRKSLNLLLALFGGGIFAVGLAFFFEYLDNRVKSPEEIKNYLGLPFLGLVPALKDKDSAEDALLHRNVSHQFAEAFRTVRTNVLFSLAEGQGGRSVVVTSTAPREGKTLVASNLSIALAQAGQRVLLVDADMRKPRVHEVFGAKQAPGLSNVLVGNAKASESVKRGPVENLWILPAGVIPPNPAELLNSRRFKDFVATLEEHFDWVIVDSPPVMAVSDPAVIAHLADGVIYVVGAEQTSKYAAAGALEQLDGAKAKFLGGILNRVNLQRNSYYYSHYYKGSYSDYYRRRDA